MDIINQIKVLPQILFRLNDLISEKLGSFPVGGMYITRENGVGCHTQINDESAPLTSFTAVPTKLCVSSLVARPPINVARIWLYRAVDIPSGMIDSINIVDRKSVV